MLFFYQTIYFVIFLLYTATSFTAGLKSKHPAFEKVTLNSRVGLETILDDDSPNLRDENDNSLLDIAVNGFSAQKNSEQKNSAQKKFDLEKKFSIIRLLCQKGLVPTSSHVTIIANSLLTNDKISQTTTESLRNIKTLHTLMKNNKNWYLVWHSVAITYFSTLDLANTIHAIYQSEQQCGKKYRSKRKHKSKASNTPQSTTNRLCNEKYKAEDILNWFFENLKTNPVPKSDLHLAVIILNQLPGYQKKLLDFLGEYFLLTDKRTFIKKHKPGLLVRTASFANIRQSYRGISPEMLARYITKNDCAFFSSVSTEKLMRDFPNYSMLQEQIQKQEKWRHFIIYSIKTPQEDLKTSQNSYNYWKKVFWELINLRNLNFAQVVFLALEDSKPYLKTSQKISLSSSKEEGKQNNLYGYDYYQKSFSCNKEPYLPSIEQTYSMLCSLKIDDYLRYDRNKKLSRETLKTLYRKKQELSEGIKFAQSNHTEENPFIEGQISLLHDCSPDSFLNMFLSIIPQKGSFLFAKRSSSNKVTSSRSIRKSIRSSRY